MNIIKSIISKANLTGQYRQARQETGDLKVISLQTALIKNTSIISLVLGCLGFFAVGMTTLYHNNQIFDDLLDANARSLLNEWSFDDLEIDEDLRYLNDDLDVEYQLFDEQGKLLAKTFHAPQTPFFQLGSQLYGSVFYDGEVWRMYLVIDPETGKQVQMIQPWRQRLEFALPILVNYLVFVVSLLTVLILGNFWIIRKSLQPLHELKEQIHLKNLKNLSQINPPVVLSETQPLLDAINQLFDRLEQASQAQERFVSDASHELRTPMAAALMKVQLLKRKFGEQPAVTQGLTDLMVDLRRTTDLVESLLTLARLDHDVTTQENLVFEKITLMSWLDGLVAEVWQGHTDHILKIYQQSLPEQATICVNSQLLFIALRNLLDNALRYGGADVIVALDAKIQDETIVITVKDNGQGVSPEDLPKLSERFFRVLGSQKQGSGLGLSIVKRVVEYHGGRVVFSQGLDNQGLGITLLLKNTA